MEWIVSGKVLHAGTLNGNPISLAAARATLDVLARDGGAVYGDLWRRGETLRQQMERLMRGAGLTVVTSGGGPVFQVSFMRKPATTYRELMEADSALYSDFAVALLDEGVLALPDGRWYLSAAHTDKDIELTLAAVERVVNGQTRTALGRA